MFVVLKELPVVLAVVGPVVVIFVLTTVLIATVETLVGRHVHGDMLLEHLEATKRDARHKSIAFFNTKGTKVLELFGFDDTHYVALNVLLRLYVRLRHATTAVHQHAEEESFSLSDVLYARRCKLWQTMIMTPEALMCIIADSWGKPEEIKQAFSYHAEGRIYSKFADEPRGASCATHEAMERIAAQLDYAYTRESTALAPDEK